MARRARPAGEPIVVGGWHVLEAAAATGHVQRAYATPDKAERAEALAGAGRVQVVAPAELSQRFGSEAHQGVVVRAAPPPVADADELVAAAVAAARPLVVLEDVQDPQNVGSVLRAARALGAAGLIATRHRSAPMGAAVLRASSGAAFHVPIAVVGGVPNWLLQVSDEVPAVAAVAAGGADPWDAPLAGAVALVLGAEGPGLKRLTVERCAARATVPMAAGDSLNVAQAATVLLYEASRQRAPGAKATGV